MKKRVARNPYDVGLTGYQTQVADRAERQLLIECDPRVQFEELRRSKILRPEQRLWAAVLDEAIADYQRARPPGDRGMRTAVERAGSISAWIASTEDYPGSFEFCCQALGLDPEYLRRGLQARGPVVEHSPRRRRARIFALGTRRQGPAAKPEPKPEPQATTPAERKRRSLAAELRRLREGMGWSQATVADRFGLTQMQISRWENGQTRPPQRLLDALRIRSRRLDLGWSQSQLADHIGTTRSAVSLWERGKRKAPSGAVAGVMAAAVKAERTEAR
jgi:transcriptional regulator with XRE-family HTH domain